MSACLYGAARQRSTRKISWFLDTRGVWLVFLEITVVGFAWSFNFHTMPFLQVIWAIGWSMLALSALVRLPRAAILTIGVVMIAGHNAVDTLQPAFSDASLLWIVLHMPGILKLGGTEAAVVVYPLIPWIGVMAVGYVLGFFFVSRDPKRPGRLILIGGALTLCFLLLRGANLYGDPNLWAPGQNTTTTLIRFLNATQYPASLQFLLMTLGPAMMLLGWLERATGRVAGILVTIGRVSLFYYILHLYIIHTIDVLIGMGQGFSLGDMTVAFLENPSDFGVSLGCVYVVWAVTIVAMYPACAWFAGVKAMRRDWWLRYF
ncbi:MAG TPA: heparan-alpha-glucosaminide N-acetyltransferase domain-containing protein [Thermodesulfobacteriota bacterium]|nr:heparan-alpha-glucosaminide N-acetyltransferase domain-containing protein [Thermodesulfobacteriota bacterium]